MAIKILALDGLNDSKLADLTAQLLETIPGVDSARIEFLSQKLTLSISGRDETEILDTVITTLEKTIPGISVSRVEVGAGEAPREAPGQPQSRYAFEELPRPAEEEPPKKRALPFLGADTALFFIGLLVGGGLFAASWIFPPEALPRRALLVLSLVIAALFSLLFRFPKNRGGYVFLSLLCATACGGVAVLGQLHQAAAGMLLWLAGALAADIVCERFESAARSVINIHPEKVSRLRDGALDQVPPEEVEPGDRVLLRTGDVIPFDGVVAEGEAKLDVSLLTGEDAPAAVRLGDPVCCGDVILKGPLTITVTEYQKFTPAARFLRMMTGEPRQTRLAGQAARYSSLISLLVAACAVAVAFLAYEPGLLSSWLVPMFTVLLLAAPTGVSAFADMALRGGIVRALRGGILLGKETTLEEISRVRTVASGFTGLLTEGVYHVARVHTAEDITTGQVVSDAAAAVNGSTHPVADAILAYYEDTMRHPLPDDAPKGEQISGYGMRAMIERRLVLVGSGRYLRDAEIETLPNGTGHPVAYVAERGECIGMMEMTDAYREGAGDLARALRAQGITKTVLLTGCDADWGLAAQGELGFDEVYAERTAQGKREAIQFLAGRDQGKVLLLVQPNEAGLVADSAGIGVQLGTSGGVQSSMLDSIHAIVPSGDPYAAVELLRAARGVRWIVLAALYASVAVKAALIVALYLWGLPFFAAAAADAVLSFGAALACAWPVLRGRA